MNSSLHSLPQQLPKFLSKLSLLLFLLCLVGAVWASNKKGVGLADLQAGDRIAALNLAWYYTWSPNPIDGAPREKFVPMLWGGKHRFDREFAHLKQYGRLPVLLAINEPDKADQANMSVDEVARLWPRISSLADSVSSPATAGVMGPWFDRFYHVARSRGLKMDFMAVHLYEPPDAVRFLQKIDAAYEKYRLPIWITEFAVADWKSKDKPGSNRYKEEEVLAFMKAVLPELEKRPYVVRYAWFGAGPKSHSTEPVRTSRLFEKDGILTPLGRYYAEFFWPEKEGCEAVNRQVPGDSQASDPCSSNPGSSWQAPH